MKKLSAYIFFVLIISLLGVLPFFSDGFFQIHDDTQVARVNQMTKSLSHGMFPVRWVSDLGYGYGYPIFNFYGPLPYYFGALFDLVVFDSLASTKAMIIIGVVISAVGMFLLSRIFWRDTAAILSALLYMYAPYHALNIYVRGAVGELYAYAFMPFVLWSMIRTYQSGKFRYVAGLSIFLALLITSHNLSALYFIPLLLFLALFLFFRTRNSQVRFFLISGLIIGASLSVFYSAPALLMLNYTNVFSQVGGGAVYSENFVCFSQLWSSNWGFGGSIPGCTDGMSFALGKYHLILGALSLFVFTQKNMNLQKKSVFLFSIIFIFSVFMTTLESKFIWDSLSFFAILQYPWRFLNLSSLSLSFLGGGVLFVILEKSKLSEDYKKIFVLIVLAFPIFLLNLKYFSPQQYLLRDSNFYLNEKYLKFDTSKISDEYMPKSFLKPKSFDEIPKEKIFSDRAKISISNLHEKTQILKARLEIDRDTDVLFRKSYYPSWRLYVDSREVKIVDMNGIISSRFKKGIYDISLEYKNSLIENLSNTVSVIGFLMLFIGIILTHKKNIL